MPNERDLTNRLRKHFENLWRTREGFSATKIAGGSRFQRAGLPDWFLCIYGRLVVLETKVKDYRLSLKQEREIARLQKSGAVVWVVKDFDRIVELVDIALDSGRLFNTFEVD